MKKIQSSLFANYFPIATGMLAGFMLCYLCNLIFLAMTYKKTATRVAGKDYVSEITRWPGHTHVINIPVYYGKLWFIYNILNMCNNLCMLERMENPKS